MLIKLTRLPESCLGIYPIGSPMPKRLRALARDAAASLVRLEQDVGCGLVFSDMYRDAAGSLKAVLAGKPAQRPSYSAHNYGLAVDLAVDESLKRLKRTYPQLLALMRAHGWYCHRLDGLRGSEDWHFNFVGSYGGSCNGLKGAQIAERLIQIRFGAEMKLSIVQQQKALTRLAYYAGVADGIVGDGTKKARKAFEQAWHLDGDEVRYQRTLAFVSATVEVEEL